MPQAGAVDLVGLVIAAVTLNASPVLTSRHTTVPAFITAGQYRRQLAPGEIVVVVSSVRNAGLLWQANTDFCLRIADGFLNDGFSHRTDLPRPVEKLAHATPAIVVQFENFIRADHVAAILLQVGHEPRWAVTFRRVGLVGHVSGAVVVYPTRGCQSCRPLDWAQLR